MNISLRPRYISTGYVTLFFTCVLLFLPAFDVHAATTPASSFFSSFPVLWSFIALLLLVCIILALRVRFFKKSLTETEGCHRALCEKQVDPLLIVGKSGHILFANAAACQAFSSDAAALCKTSFSFPIREDETTEVAITATDGTAQTFELRAAPVSWHGDTAHLVSMRNVSRRKKVEQELRDSEERYRTVADYTHGCETWISPDGKVLYASPACAQLTGYDLETFKSSADFLAGLVHRDDLPLWYEHMHSSERFGDTLDFRITSAEGRELWLSQVSRPVFDADGTPLGQRCSLRNISARKNLEQQLKHQALHDSLTGVGNRVMCLDRIMLGLERAKRREDYFYAVAFIGLDRFKMVNESMGHDFGDKVLIEAGKRLTANVRHLDTVSRFGGDEFVLFLEELMSPREATLIIKRIHDDLREPYKIDGEEVQVTASLGAVLSPADYAKPEDLIRNANIAMYRAKEAGRDRFKIFNTKMLEQAIRQMHLENDLRRGILENEFFLVYQPIVDINSGVLLGFEALLRWAHPEKGLVMPGDFIPMAEDTGLIVDLGAWSLAQGCRQLHRWREELPQSEHLFLSVNISGRQFSQPGLVDVVKRSLQQNMIPPKNIKLEITETTIMDDPEMAAEKLLRLKDLGVTLSIDDFGTGYSSLSYLQRFPLDNLKIDLSFVRMMEHSPENIEIVKAIIDLAHTLKLEVVAEGVETILQKQALKSLGCEYAQGFFFSKPVNAERARQLIVEMDTDVDDRDAEAMLTA